MRTIPTSLPLKWCLIRSTCRKDWSKAEKEEKERGRRMKKGSDHRCCCILQLSLQEGNERGEEDSKESSHFLTGEHLEGISLREVRAKSDLLQLKEVLYLL